MPPRPAGDHMRVTECGRHVELGVRHRPFPEHRVVRIEHLGLAPLAGEHRKRPTHPVHPVPFGQPSTTPVTALCGHSRGPGRSSTTSRLATQPVWSRGARDSRLAIRSPRRHFAAGRHRRTVVHRRAPRSVQFPQAAEPFWNEATEVRPGQPVNAERTNRRPMGHVLPRRLSHVSGNPFVQKPSAKCFTRSARCPKSRRFSRCSAHGADWHKRCAGRCPPSGSGYAESSAAALRLVTHAGQPCHHSPAGWANLLVVLPTPTTLRVTGRQSAAG